LKNVQHLTQDRNSLETYLKGKGWLRLQERVKAVEIPGAGNMNFTLRVKSTDRSFVLKQSRAYVEKYPQVAAPAERALREAEFYNLVASHKQLSTFMPELIDIDPENHVLNLEDLGNSTDYSFLYKAGNTLDIEELKAIIGFIASLHTTITTSTTAERLPNREMRKLNHEHIFIYPFVEDNGINLDDILPGLKAVGEIYKKDSVLIQAVAQLGERYLEDGDVLLHGDYFPGSWLKTADGIKIIDPEFCFFGDPEFEIGVTLAHLKMANQPKELVAKALEFYTEKAPLDETLCFQYMAVELLRRILGLAQLPLTLDLETRKGLLEEARMILTGAKR